MAVRKKSLDTTGDGGKIDLSSHLQQVREAIKQLPEEGENMEQEGTTEAQPEAPQPAAPATKRKSTVKKKVAKKTIAKKSNGATPAEAGTTLAVIAKSMKLEPRRARRILRTADGVPDAGTRWTWTKASDVAKVKSILTKATREE